MKWLKFSQKHAEQLTNMQSFVGFILYVAWVAVIMNAKGFWSTFFAIFIALLVLLFGFRKID